MSPDTVQAIQTALAPVAAKIGEGAQYGWEVVVAQQKVTAIGDFLAALFFFLVVVFCVWLFSRGYKNYVKDSWDDTPAMNMALGVSFGVVALAATLGCIFVGIAHLLNPAYYALDFFIHLTK